MSKRFCEHISFSFGVHQHLEKVIRQRIPSIIALINKTIDELNAELDRIGRPIGVDGGVIPKTQ